MKDKATPKQNKWNDMLFRRKVLSRAGILGKPFAESTKAFLKRKGVKVPKGTRI